MSPLERLAAAFGLLFIILSTFMGYLYGTENSVLELSDASHAELQHAREGERLAVCNHGLLDYKWRLRECISNKTHLSRLSTLASMVSNASLRAQLETDMPEVIAALQTTRSPESELSPRGLLSALLEEASRLHLLHAALVEQCPASALSILDAPTSSAPRASYPPPPYPPNASAPLWSRGWHRLIGACRMPERYYAEYGTERRASGEELRAVGGCPLVWVRSMTGTPNNDPTEFVKHVLPSMTRPFTLVTTDGDNAQPSAVAGYERLLEHPNLVAWYVQNYDGTGHPKLRGVPIGFDLHTPHPKFRQFDAGFAQAREVRQRHLGRPRTFGVLFDAMGTSHGERWVAAQQLECTPHMHFGRMPPTDLWEEYGTWTFGVSPRGNGLDCHRTWEMIYMGMVPIVKSSSIDVLFDGLPVLIVKEWRDVCRLDLRAEYERLKPLLPAPEEVFTIGHWVPTVPQADGTVEGRLSPPRQAPEARRVSLR
eukprot:TRINITY_DN2274_c0_g1_i1.p1 TRINITY_DN2274_c0_g1~~TRINITY_DN2274_c0_g1_i1.p1  ORF type:complete len:483 (-),score=78.88 TRINITY_DN2274_c0_g1_i1:23-1471(-)